MPKSVFIDGKRNWFPDDFTDDDISAALNSPHAQATAATSTDTGQVPAMGANGRPTMRPDLGPEMKAADPGTFEGRGTATRGLKIGLQGQGQGLAEFVGAPTDLAVGAANLATHGINKVTGTEIPAIPYSGSGAISNFASKAAQALGYEPAVPTTLREHVGYEANRFLGNILATKGAISALPVRTEAQIVPRVTGMRTQPPTALENMQRANGGESVKTAAGDVMGAAGAGTANALYHESGGSDVAHSMPGGSVIGPVADAVVPMLGGVAGGAAAPILAAPFKVAGHIYNKATGQAIAADQPVDPVTGRPHTNKNLDSAALIMQDMASNPVRAADEIQGTREALVPNTVSGSEMPPATAISDPGVASLGAAMKRGNPVPHMENEQQVNTAARRNLDQAVPEGADPWAFPQRIEEVANRRTARAQEDVMAAEANAQRELEGRQQDAAQLPPEPQQGRVDASAALHRQIIDESQAPMSAASRALYDAVPDTQVPSDSLHALAADIRARHANLAPNTRDLAVPENVLRDLEWHVQRDAEGAPVLDTSGNTILAPVGLQTLNRYSNTINAERESAKNGQAPLHPDRLRNLERIQGAIRGIVDQHPDAAAATNNYSQIYGPVWGKGAGEAYDFRRDFNKDRLGETAVPPSETAKRFMGANAPEKSEALQRILQTIPDPARAHAAVREYLLSDMAANGAVAADGTLRPMAIQRWADRNSANLDLAPGVRDEIAGYVERARQGEQTAGQLTDELRTARTGLRQTEEQINRGAFRNVIGADPEHAVRAIFESNNPEAAMQELLSAIGAHVEPRNGLKAAIRDYMLQKGTPKLEHTIEGGAKPISFQKLDETFDQHRNTLSYVFTPSEMHSLEVARQFLAPFRNLEVPGTAANVNNARMSDETWRMVEAGMKIRYGMLKGGGITRTLKTAAAAVLPKENAGVKAILEQMQFDPELAQHLLTRDVSEVNSPMWTKKLFQLMGVEEAARNSNRDERR